MFTEKELKTTISFIRKKKRATLNSRNGSDLDYFKNLITLAKLEDATIKKLEQEKGDKHAQGS